MSAEQPRRATYDAGRYSVRSEINAGAFSRILEAYDVDRDERVALKVLPVAGTHRAIAETIPDNQLSEDYILPSVFNPAVAERVAAAVSAEEINGLSIVSVAASPPSAVTSTMMSSAPDTALGLPAMSYL